MIRIALLLVCLTFSLSGHADPVVKKAVESRFPEIKIDQITKTGYGNLYEIYAGSELFYTDEKATFVLLGQIIDGKSRENITEARLRKLTAIAFNDLPLDQAIKTVIGNGKRRIAVFSDPYCGYCKRFEPDLLSMADVTVYTFLYPIIRQESVPLSKKVWCSKDRVKAWQDLMLRNIEPTADESCDNPISQVVALGKKLRVSGTPTTVFEDGERIAGALTREVMEKKLASAAAAQKK